MRYSYNLFLKASFYYYPPIYTYVYPAGNLAKYFEKKQSLFDLNERVQGVVRWFSFASENTNYCNYYYYWSRYYATSLKVAGSSPDEVDFFQFT
jgi:hypothetical protein